MDRAVTIRWATAVLVAACAAAGCGEDGGPSRPSRRSPGPLNIEADWPIFRGDRALTGRADGSLDVPLTLYWRRSAGSPISSSPVVADGQIYFGCDEGKLYALRAADGEQQWTCETDGPVGAPPLVRDGVVYVGSSDWSLHAVGVDGERRWVYETEAQIEGGANIATTGDGETVVLVGSYDSRLHCVRADDGERVWTYATENYINGAPAVAGGRAVVVGCDFNVHAVSIADGSGTAIPTGEKSYLAGSPAVVEGVAFTGSYGSKVLAADLEGGEILWEFATPEPVFAPPAVAGGRVVIGCRDGTVYCLDADDGDEIWTFGAGGKVDGGAVICDGKVIVGSSAGRLYVLDLDDGAELWSYETGEGIVTTPAVAGGAVIVTCDGGSVFAFGPAPEERP